MKNNKRYLKKDDVTFNDGTTFDGGEATETGNFNLSRWWLNLGGD